MEPPSRPSTSYREPAFAAAGNTQPTSTESSWMSSAQSPSLPPNRFDSSNIPPHTSLGQFSYAPATETKVVTTTTTTTTTFPPFVLKAPRHLNELDPKLYPLAASPTPRSIKRFCFDYHGTPTFFREADDVRTSMKTATQQYEALRNGQTIRSVTQHTPQLETPKTHAPPATLKLDSRHSTPVSISEAAKIASAQEGQNKRRIDDVFGEEPSSSVRPAAFHPFHPAVPITPDTVDHRSASHRPQHVVHPPTHPLAHTQISPQSPQYDLVENPLDHAMAEPDTQTPSRPDLTNESSFEEIDHFEQDDAHESSSRLAATATPPIAETDLQLTDPDVPEESNPRPARPRLNEAVTQDLSLPSPSLSPVTAAQNHGLRLRLAGDGHTNEEGEESDNVSNLDLEPVHGEVEAGELARKKPTFPASLANRLMKPDFSNPQLPSPGIADIPSMIDAFDSMPPELQTYMMYQFLRRCSKNTLQVVADSVNPALKCDFLVLLPTELSLNVVRYLDARSLCRAAQVSKKWRRIVDSNEQAWKELFIRDGYTLPSGELTQAINEGWGWQHPQGSTDSEVDLNQVPTPSSTYQHAESSSQPLIKFKGDHYDFTPSPSARGKRKAAVKYASRKIQKRRDFSRPLFDREYYSDSMFDSTNSEGPYAAANAAATAIPSVSFGMPSLQNLHLFKSIYRRHHLIHKAWVAKDSKPKHIAFRAHLRHVVTCLQFDDDKIITGSDDTNINVYDTKTGALRSKLEGHEGGVWALKYHGNVLVSGSTDRSVRVWDIEKGRCTQVFQGHTSTVRCLQMLMPTQIDKLADGSPVMMPKIPLIITGSRDSNLRVWRLPKHGDPEYLAAGPPLNDSDCPYFVRTLAGHLHSVRAIAAHGDTLVSGSYDATVRVWKISTGETIHRLTGHTQKVYSVVLDTKRNRCISGSMDFMVKVWNLETGTVLFNLEGHTSLVGLLDLGSERLISAAADATLRIWDPENGQCKSTLSAHTGAITCFQHDFQKVISGSDRTLKIWDVKTGECLRDLLHGLSGVWQVKFNERRCVAAVQREGLTYIEVLDYGASRDGVSPSELGRRIVVNRSGEEIDETNMSDSEDHPIADDE